MTEKEILDSRLRYLGLNLDFTRRYTFTRSWKKPDIMLDKNRLMFVAEGYIYIIIDNRKDMVKTGQVAYIPDGIVADVFVDKGVTAVIYDCQFSTPVYNETMNRYLSIGPVINPKTRAKAERLFETLVKYDNPQNMDEVLIRIGILTELLRYLFVGLDSTNFVRSKRKGLDLTETLCYIDNNLLKKNLTIGDLAKRINVSIRNFQRIFKTQFGVSCNEYIQSRKLTEIMKLIQNTNISMNQIAVQYMFADTASFSRFIKKHTGMSPSDIRRSERCDHM